MTRVLLVDNRDSFTFNLVYDLEALGCTVEVFRNHAPADALLARARESGAVVVLSPGPGAPRDAGCCVELVRAAGPVGVLGVCLGHQVIVEAFGGVVGAAATVVHGRATQVERADHPLFDGLPARLAVGRYHSLAATSLPPDLTAIAHTSDGAVMAVTHSARSAIGVQFHPESILTEGGRRLLANALTLLETDHVASA